MGRLGVHKEEVMEHITGFYGLPLDLSERKELPGKHRRENNGQEGSNEPVALSITWEHPKAGLGLSADRAVSSHTGVP